MYHFVYRTIRSATNEYYIGKHSTNNLEDGYQGTGTWVRSCLKGDVHLITGVINFYPTSIEAYQAEQTILGSSWDSDPLCMNFMRGGFGGKTGYISKRSKHIYVGSFKLGNKESYLGGQVAYEQRKGVHTEENKRNCSKRENALSKQGKHNFQNLRYDQRGQFKGWWHTPDACFVSIYAAGDYYNIHPTTVYVRAKNIGEKWKDWYIILKDKYSDIQNRKIQ